MVFWSLFCIVVLLTIGGYRLGNYNFPKQTYWFTIAIIIVISAIRFDVGFDYQSYWHMITDSSIEQEDFFYLEPSIQFCIFISRKFEYPPLIFILFSIVTYIVAGIAIWKNSNSMSLSTLIYLALFYLPSLGFVRQGAALSFVLLSYPYVLDRNLFKFLLCCSTAILFHFSAIFALAIYPLYGLSRKTLLIIVISLPFLFNSLLILLSKIYPSLSYLSYINHLDALTGGNLMKYMNVALVGGTYILSLKIKDIELSKMILISGVGVVFPFILGGHIGGRLSWYYMIFLCLSLPKILESYKKYVSRLCIVGFVTIFVTTIYISDQSNEKKQYTPYQTIFNINIDSPKFK